MISAVSKRFRIHPQTLRLYEREGLLKPTRTEGNTRLYSDSDLERLSLILNLTREMRVNLAGVEIVLNMREKMARMQAEIERFVRLLGREMDKIRSAGSGGGVRTSLVRVSGRSEEPVQRGKDGKTTSKR